MRLVFHIIALDVIAAAVVIADVDDVDAAAVLLFAAVDIAKNKYVTSDN